MNHVLERLRLEQVSEPPPMEAMLAGARETVHRRRRNRSLAGSVAGLAVAALAVLAPAAVRVPSATGDELHGQLCAPSVCTAWCSPDSAEPSGPAICGLHEVACLAEGCG